MKFERLFCIDTENDLEVSGATESFAVISLAGFCVGKWLFTMCYLGTIWKEKKHSLSFSSSC